MEFPLEMNCARKGNHDIQEPVERMWPLRINQTTVVGSYFGDELSLYISNMYVV